MIIMISVNCLMSLTETSMVLKYFSYTMSLNPCPVVQRCIGIILILIGLQCFRIFLTFIVNYFCSKEHPFTFLKL